MPEQFAFHARGGMLLVCDTGASGLRAAVCDLSGEVLLERTAAINIADGPGPVLDLVGRIFADLRREVFATPELAGQVGPRVCGVAMSVPGPVEFDAGRAVSPPIMTGWDGFGIGDHLSERYGCPVVVDNDVNVMALGEQRACFPEVEHLLMVKAGTGVGSGIVNEGRIDPDPPACRCGNIGCVEAYAGGWALARDLAAQGFDVPTVDHVVALVRAGEPAAVQLARQAGRLLGEAIAGAVSLLNPSVVVLGGQLATADEQVLAGVRERVYQRSLPLATRNLTITRTRLGPRGGLTGLAHLLTDTIFAPSQIHLMLTPH